MWAASYGGMAQVENARIFPDMVYELRDRIDRKARVNHEGRWPPDGGTDWNEALLAPAKFRVYARVGHGRGAEVSPRISVGLGARDLIPGEVAACARLRFDHDRLVPNLRKLVSNDARGNVDNSAGRIGHDHMDRPVRKVGLCMRRAYDQHPCDRRPTEQCDEIAPFHLRGHSITSSARPSRESGRVRPSALAVLRLITNSTLVDCWTDIPPPNSHSIARMQGLCLPDRGIVYPLFQRVEMLGM